MSKNNKRKRGRPRIHPKKRKLFKGITYIASKLQKNYPHKYKNRESARVRARELYPSILESGEKVSYKSISSRERKKRIPKQGVPELPEEMLAAMCYFEASQYPLLIMGCDPRIRFESKIVPADLPIIVGGEDVSYSDYFKPFVDYVNELRTFMDEGYLDPYADEWLIRTLPPVKSKEYDGMYICRIIACDSSGQEHEYGFDAYNPHEAAKDFIISDNEHEYSKVDSKPGEGPTSTSTTSSDIDKQIRFKEKEIELSKLQLKSQALTDAKELLRDKVITFEQYKELINLNK